jgi:hypothetical protein
MVAICGGGSLGEFPSLVRLDRELSRRASPPTVAGTSRSTHGGGRLANVERIELPVRTTNSILPLSQGLWLLPAWAGAMPRAMMGASLRANIWYHPGLTE